MKELMRAAHKMAKEIKAEFPSVDYKAQLGICMSYLIEERKGDSKMKELKGSEKQIKWGNDILSMVAELKEQFNIAYNKVVEVKGSKEKATLELKKDELIDVEKTIKTFELTERCENASVLIDSYFSLRKKDVEYLKKEVSSERIDSIYAKMFNISNIVISGFKNLMAEDRKDLIELVGSKDEISSAKVIRVGWMEEIKAHQEYFEKEIKAETRERVINSYTKRLNRVNNLSKRLETETNAKWFIKNKDQSLKQFGFTWS